MRLSRILVPVLFALPLIGVACGGHDDGDAEPFDTLEDCYTDHHVSEGFDINTSIKICCIDHPIGGQAANVVCGETQADCEAFVDAEITDTDVTLADITQACSEYLVERGQ